MSTYRIYCEEEANHIIGYGTPTEVCPNDGGHTVTSGSLVVLNSRVGGTRFKKIQRYSGNGQRLSQNNDSLIDMSVSVPPGTYRVEFSATIKLSRNRSNLICDIFVDETPVSSGTRRELDSESPLDNNLHIIDIVNVPQAGSISVRGYGTKGKTIFKSGLLIIEEE